MQEVNNYLTKEEIEITNKYMKNIQPFQQKVKPQSVINTLIKQTLPSGGENVELGYSPPLDACATISLKLNT